MNIQQVHVVSFSPTQTSRRVAEAVARGVQASDVQCHDLTLQAEEVQIPADALAVVAVPVYGGHVAPVAVQRLKSVQGNHTPAVAVVVYGNRAYEQALVELDALLSAQGFQVVAGGTFIGEHSYSTLQHPIAVGRPDASDVAFAESFGAKVKAKIEAAADREHLYGVDVRRIQRPRQPFIPLFRFLRRVIKLRKSGVPMPRTPQVDEALCSHCGWCAAHCPVQAITPGSEQCTDASLCIRCCACVKGCPQQARTFDTPFAALLSDCFRRPKENRIIL